MKIGAKERIIEAAIPMFCEQGFRATGIDLILKKANVAKMSLYYHFPSKEDLIAECLNVLDERDFNRYVSELEKISDDPMERLRQVLAPLRLLFTSGTPFYGCPFIKAAAEYQEPNDGIHLRAISYKQRFQRLFQKLCSEAQLPQSATTADQIQIIFEGVMTLFQLRQDPSIVDAAEAMLQLILDPRVETSITPPQRS